MPKFERIINGYIRVLLVTSTFFKLTIFDCTSRKLKESGREITHDYDQTFDTKTSLFWTNRISSSLFFVCLET